MAQEGPCGSPDEAGKLCSGVFELTGHEGLARGLAHASDAEGIQIASAQRMVLDQPTAEPEGTADGDWRAPVGCTCEPTDNPDLGEPARHS